MSVPPSTPNPFSPPQGNPYGPPPPAQPAAVMQPAQHPWPLQGYPTSPQQWHPVQPFQATPQKHGNGLAVTAIVLSALALLGVLGLGIFAVGASMGPSWVLAGKVEVSGASVAGADLEAALGEVIEDDGSLVDEIGCPDSSAVGQGLVTVCHGSVDGWDWTGVVVFEDAQGAFIVNQL